MMTFDILVSKEAGEEYIARPLAWPDLVAHGKTEQAAVAAVRTMLQDRLQATRLVQIEVDIPNPSSVNPWLTMAGLFKDDPTWDEFQAAMTDYRRQVDTKTTQQPE
ncbi:MAG: hypothetical protein KIT87_24705 [Anaerolineae bacterium]|nr:hypothetical protein [Anaerolineae bacterium]